METRVFHRPVTVQSTDGEYVDTFNRPVRPSNLFSSRRIKDNRSDYDASLTPVAHWPIPLFRLRLPRS